MPVSPNNREWVDLRRPHNNPEAYDRVVLAEALIGVLALHELQVNEALEVLSQAFITTAHRYGAHEEGIHAAETMQDMLRNPGLLDQSIPPGRKL